MALYKHNSFDSNFLCLSQSVVPENALKQRLEPETLEAAGLIQSTKLFNTKLIRTKTRLL